MLAKGTPRQIVLCLIAGGALALSAQGYHNARITSLKQLGDGRIEARVQAATTGDAAESANDVAATFKLKENGVTQDSLKVEKAESESGSRTVLLADLSRSLHRRQFADYKKAALAFVDRLKPGDQVALVTFDRRVFRTANFTSDRELLKNKIRQLKQTGSRTMLYDAILEAHKLLRDVPQQRAIVVYTDGKENASRVVIGDLIELFTANPVPLFVAGRYRSFSLKQVIRLARISGGDAFRAQNSHDLDKVFRYLSRLKTQDFKLTYATRQKPGAALDIEIESALSAASLVRSYTLPHNPAASLGAGESRKESEQSETLHWPTQIRSHMPEILLSLIVILLIAVIIMLFFRRQEINVKVENSNPPAYVAPEDMSLLPARKLPQTKAKLPLDYHHGWLVEKEGPHTGRKYRINWHNISIGFAEDNSIVIDDSTVSARHAKIERQKQKFVLYDLMSEHGTYLNGKKLLRPKELNDFDEISLGRTKLIFRKSAATYERDPDEEN